MVPGLYRAMLGLTLVLVGAAPALLVMRPGSDAAAGEAAEVLRGIASVSDGDTLRVGETRVRLFGVDAPETHQSCDIDTRDTWACGEAAADRLRVLVAGQEVTCVVADEDRYGRRVARCAAGGTDLGAELVREGLARAYTRFGDDYAALEEQARTGGIGLWHGTTEAPWDYRAEKREKIENRLTPQTPHDASCVIKGNVSTGGGHVYHVPGGQFYEKTRIDPRRGEAWFCTEEEAQHAGFRRAAE